jgi:hypothetical protein
VAFQSASPYAWVFVTGVSLLVFGPFEVGQALLAQPLAKMDLLGGVLSTLGGAVLTPVGLWVWARR